jgi:glutaconate CoA-transferase subunit B
LSKRRFLERVDFNTCPGYFDGKPGRREEVGLRPHTGPTDVITDLGEYVFEDREMVLKSVHTGVGVTLEKVKSEVSWDLKVTADLTESRPPTDEELRIYREKIQPVRAMAMAARTPPR